ncbi:MAG: hypothetical protein AB9903_22600 [Vulcanimicrobiota bacterium]
MKVDDYPDISTIKDFKARFQSFNQLSPFHYSLLEEGSKEENQPYNSEFISILLDFIKKACATGKILYSSKERNEAQNIINYWFTVAYSVGEKPENFELEDADTSLLSNFSKMDTPYNGLKPFEYKDAENFFGRNEDVKKLLELIKNNKRLLAVIGLPGSGKTSLITAGLIPKLGKDQYCFEIIKPYNEPIKSLSKFLNTELDIELFIKNVKYREDKLKEKVKGPSILIIDQFEELFTLCSEIKHRKIFIESLLKFASFKDCIVIVLMRSGFEGYVIYHDEFWKLFQEGFLQVNTPAKEQLHKIIEEPTIMMEKIDENSDYKINLAYDEGLVDKIIEDIKDIEGGHAALSLLQFSMEQLWNNKIGNSITWDVYESLGNGGIAKAYSNYMDKIYKKLDKINKSALKSVLLTFFKLAENQTITTITSSPVTYKELRIWAKSDEEKKAVKDTLELLIKQGLIKCQNKVFKEDELAHFVFNTDDCFVIQHEELILTWEELQVCIEEKRRKESVLIQVYELARKWDEKGRDPNLLLSGKFLEKAHNVNEIEFKGFEIEYFNKSKKANNKKQRMRWIKRGIVTIGFFIILCMYLQSCLGALRLREYISSIAAGVNRKLLIDTNKSYSLIIDATSSMNTNPDRSILLAKEALKNLPSEKKINEIVKDAINEAGYKSNREIFKEQLYINIKMLLNKKPEKNNLKNIADEIIDKLRMTYCPPAEGVLLNMLQRYSYIQKFMYLPNNPNSEKENGIFGIAFSKDGKTIAALRENNNILYWKCPDIKSEPDIISLPIPKNKTKIEVGRVDFSTDGQRLKVGYNGQAPIIKILESGASNGWNYSTNIGCVTSYAFNPKDDNIAGWGYNDGLVIIKDINRSETLIQDRFKKAIRAVTFSPDGKFFAIAGDDGLIALYKRDVYSYHREFPQNISSDTVDAAFKADLKELISNILDKNEKLNNVSLKALDDSLKKSLSDKLGGTIKDFVKGVIKNNFTEAAINTCINDAYIKYKNETYNGEKKDLKTFLYEEYEKLVSNSEKNAEEITESQVKAVFNRVVKDYSPISDFKKGIDNLKSSINNDLIGDDQTSSQSDNLINEVNKFLKAQSSNNAINDNFKSITFDNNSRFIFLGNSDGDIHLFDRLSLENNKIDNFIKKENCHHGSIQCMAFSPKSDILASCSDDRNIYLWDISMLKYYYNKDKLNSTLNDLQKIEKSVKSNEWRKIANFRGHSREVRCIDFSSNGKKLVSSGVDGKIILWDVPFDLYKAKEDNITIANNEDILNKSRTIEGKLKKVFYFSSEKSIIALNGDKIIEWPVNSDNYLVIKEKVLDFEMNKKGNALAIVEEKNGNCVNQYECSWKQSILKISDKPSTVYEIPSKVKVKIFKFNPNGKNISFVTQNNDIYFCRTGEKELYQIPDKGNLESIKCLTFSNKGDLLAASGKDGDMKYICLWNISEPSNVILKKKIKSANDKDINAITIYQETKQLNAQDFIAYGDDSGTIIFRNITENEDIYSINGYSKSIVSISFSCDGKNIYSGSEDSKVIIWNAYTGIPIGSAFTGPDETSCKIFTDCDTDNKDRHLIMIYTQNKEKGFTGRSLIKIFDMNRNEWEKIAHKIANRALTEKERKQYVEIYEKKQ